MRTEMNYALAESYASEYISARDYMTENARDVAWNAVRAGYLKALEHQCKACKELIVAGSDSCSKCDEGRVTLYRQGNLCLSCKLESVKLAGKEKK